MKIKISFLLLFLSINLAAQPVKFQLTVGDAQSETGNSIFQTSDGGYIVAGATYPTFSNANVYVAKVNSSGVLQWTKTYGGNSNDIAHSIIETTGGYLIAGETESFANSREALLIRTDLNGDTLWTKTYGGNGSDIANKIEELPSGNLLLSGSFQINGVNQMGLIRLDSAGGILGQGYVSPYQFASPINKATYLGNGKVGFTGANPYMVLADTNGTYINTYADFSGGRSVDALVTYDQKYASLIYDNVGGAQGSNITLSKLNPLTTSTIFSKKFSTNFDDTPVSFVEANDHGFVILATSFTSFSSNQSLLLIKTDSVGNLQWTKRYAVSVGEDNFAGQVVKTSDGGYAIAASTTINGNFSNYEYYIVKTDSAGDSFCNQTPVTFTQGTAIAASGTLPVPLLYSVANTGTLVAPPLSTYGLLNTICITLNVSETHLENNSIVLFPNPTNGNFKISFNNSYQEKKVSIINDLGQVVFSREDLKENVLQVNLINYSKGIYVIKIDTCGSTFNKKIVVSN